MNWRRGLLLAGIHFAIAAPLVVWEEAAVWPYHPEHDPPPLVVLGAAGKGGDDQTVAFYPDPCRMTGRLSDQATVLVAAEFPAMIVSGWRPQCHPSWSFAGLIGANFLRNTRSEERRIAAAFCLLIPIQWFFLGSIPRARPRRWYAEPGAFITACFAIAAIPLCIAPVLWAFRVGEFPHIPEGLGILARLPILGMIPAWLLWFLLSVWTCLAFAWRKIKRPHPAVIASP